MRIEYLDGSVSSQGDSINHHDFPDESALKQTGTRIYLLYRPGHYDILYPKQEG